ncbi:DUF968 domain-containing protein [Buttiauxella selenatireducens]|uniref:DUF968 domain-containing protein n=1 Tax=Buttiauxella selenatireducens TaxID=3073902 RepID=A0ABY9S6T0_9ENTR|nr:DUF968 domain-containing protein [Buttiauxella sp. R73]WMY72755.1 DUF968 domain-containing protein [Buttiauxella sp. R73]
MRVILTPEIAPRLGLALFRPGSDVMALFHQGRVLIEGVPEHLQHLPSGIVPAASQPLSGDKALLAFFTNERVIQAAGGLSTLNASLLRENGCQYPQGDYHHPEMVIMPYPPSAIRVCWHCDNKLREQATELLADLAHRNVVEFVIASALRNLGFDDTHQLTLPELCWWAIRYDLVDCLPEGMARKALRKPEEPILSVYKESDIVPSLPATSIVQEKIKPVLALKADPESPESYMLKPKRRRWESAIYTRWVKQQPCECCRRPADDPHHIIGHGMGGTATKAHDLFVIPLCRECHDELHADVAAFEQKHGTQLELVFRFLDRVMAIGVIVKA